MTENKNNEKPTVCKVIKYEKDIHPYPLIKLYSGVGSGKSYFATKMITGSEEYEIPEHNVLIITSRRAKVEETLKEMGILIEERITKNGNLSFEVWQSGEKRPYELEKYAKDIKVETILGEESVCVHNKSVVCTNAYISAYLRYVHNPLDPTTHIWNRFDAIIVDEIHSLVTDATYQGATFDVLALIHEYLNLCKNDALQECSCKHMILMTGTPEPFDALVKLDFPQELTHTMNLLEICKNVVPKNVILVDKETATTQIQRLLSNGEKVIYFTNHTLTESTTKKKFGLPLTTNIGVSFSKEEKRKLLPEDEKTKLRNIDKNLSEKNLIPEDIEFFVSTSRNKEGINIKNIDFHNMFVETHLMYDAVQMAGRVRQGVENLYIISNSEPFSNANFYLDISFSKTHMIATDDCPNSSDDVNRYFRNKIIKTEFEESIDYEAQRENIIAYIKYIEDRFSYIRYHVFHQKFEFFHIKDAAEKMASLQNKKFDETLLSENNDYIEHWFPYSSVKREVSTQEYCEQYLRAIIGKKAYAILTKDVMKKAMIVIKERFHSELKEIKPLLNLVDKKYNFRKRTNDYILYYGDVFPDMKPKPMKKRRKS